MIKKFRVVRHSLEHVHRGLLVALEARVDVVEATAELFLVHHPLARIRNLNRLAIHGALCLRHISGTHWRSVPARMWLVQ